MNIDERILKLESQLGDLTSRMDAISGLAGKVSTRARELYNEEREQILKKCGKARERLNELKLKKAQSWEDETIGDAVLEIFDEIGDRLDKLFSDNSPDTNKH